MANHAANFRIENLRNRHPSANPSPGLAQGGKRFSGTLRFADP